MTEVVFQKKLIKVSSSDNNNKFWNIIAYSNGVIEREWGRVSKAPRTKKENVGSPEHYARNLMNKKIKDGYREIETIDSVSAHNTKEDLKETALTQLTKDKSKEVQELIENLVDSNIHNILKNTSLQYDKDSGLFSTPLGIIGNESIKKARIKLDEITIKINNNEFDKEWIKLCEDYLMIVPHEVGSKIQLDNILGTLNHIQKETNILKSLEASIEMAKKQTKDKTKKSNEQLFDVDIDLVTDEKIIDYVKNKFTRNLSRNHPSSRLKVNRVFELNIKDMTQKFTEIEEKIGNKRKLWHGTRVGNLLSILHKGMIIPPEQSGIVTGRMFGNGLYFSDISTKALNYSYGTWNKSGLSNNNCYYALICNVLLGKEFQADRTHFQDQKYYPRKGYDSTIAKSGTLNLINNEMIVYKTEQVAPKYLVEFV